MLYDFLIRAILAGIGAALAAAPLGCFMVWRRMAFFGDATAHAAILGVALAVALSLPVFLGALAVALIMGAVVSDMAGRQHGADTILGVLSHSALALGLMAVALFGDGRLDLMALLFGDILTVGRGDLVIVWGGAALVILILSWRWSALILSTLNADLATASGIDPVRETRLLTLCLALVVAVAIKIVGVLLIAALLIIPAAAARPLVRTPEAMALVAAGIGVGAVVAGLQLSAYVDTPAGPSIVSVATGVFLLSMVVTAWRRRSRNGASGRV